VLGISQSQFAANTVPAVLTASFESNAGDDVKVQPRPEDGWMHRSLLKGCNAARQSLVVCRLNRPTVTRHDVAGAVRARTRVVPSIRRASICNVTSAQRVWVRVTRLAVENYRHFVTNRCIGAVHHLESRRCAVRLAQ
jgi:hypothetical protein